MRHDGRAAAADVLRHAHPRVLDLIGAGLAGQLFDQFHDLIDAGGADRMAAAFETRPWC